MCLIRKIRVRCSNCGLASSDRFSTLSLSFAKTEILDANTLFVISVISQ